MTTREPVADQGGKPGRQLDQTAAERSEEVVQVQEFTGDGATGANRAYGNVAGNQGMVVRPREKEDR